MGKFFKKTGKNGQYYFVLKAGNGETILQSEMYTSKAGVDNGIKSVQSNCGIDERYDRKISSNMQYYFTLKARNGEVIGKSEMYTSTAGRDKGIESVKVNGTSTSVVEE